MKTDEMTINKYEVFWREVFLIHIRVTDVGFATSVADQALQTYKLRHQKGEFLELTNED